MHKYLKLYFNLKDEIKTIAIKNELMIIEKEDVLFTGDTLFSGGCGKFFEGEAEQMLKNFRLINSFLYSTVVLPGHEYTASNLNWALKVDQDNPHIKETFQKVKESPNSFHIPSTIEKERRINLFMQCDTKRLKDLLKCSDPIKLMNKLRNMKNEGKGL